MYNGIGLSTPRGSGTNGHVQRNLSYIKDHNPSGRSGHGHGARPGSHLAYEPDKFAHALAPRKANQDILLHERKRAIEVACAELEMQLEDQDEPEAAIEAQVSALRAKLTKQLETDAPPPAPTTNLASSHERVVAKHQENERFASALRIESHVPGLAFDRDAMAKRKDDEMAERDRKREQREQEKLAAVLAVIVDEVRRGVRPAADLDKAQAELGFTWDDVKAKVPVRLLPAGLRPAPPAHAQRAPMAVGGSRYRAQGPRDRSYSRSRSPPRRARYDDRYRSYRRSPSYSRSRSRSPHSPPPPRRRRGSGSDVEMGEIVSPPRGRRRLSRSRSRSRSFSRSRSPPVRRTHDRRSLSRSVSRSRSRSRSRDVVVRRSISPAHVPRPRSVSPDKADKDGEKKGDEEMRGRSLERRPRRASRQASGSSAASRSVSRSVSRSLSRSPSP